MQVVLLGSAPDHRIQNDFVNMANQLHSLHNDRARFCLAYDEPLSHLVIYLGAEMFGNVRPLYVQHNRAPSTHLKFLF